MSVGFAIGFSLGAMTFALGALALAAWGIIEVLSFKRSTHNIQYMPVDSAFPNIATDEEGDKAFRDQMEKMNAEFMTPPMQNEVI